MSLAPVSSSAMIADRTYLVGLDGSDLSWEALRLATRIMGPKDDVHALAIVKPGGAPESLVADAEGILRGAGLLGAARGGAQFVVETEALKDGWTIAQQLIYAANHVNNRRGILVMGAAGGGAEGKAHPAGNPPMGSVARDALHQVKVPLVLVRGNPTRAPSKSDVASPPAAAASAAAAADGGAHARAPMTVAVCVDDDSVSDHAFDVRRAISESTHRDSFRIRRTADADAHPSVSTHRTGRHSVLPAGRRPRRSPRRRC